MAKFVAVIRITNTNTKEQTKSEETACVSGIMLFVWFNKPRRTVVLYIYIYIYIYICVCVYKRDCEILSCSFHGKPGVLAS